MSTLHVFIGAHGSERNEKANLFAQTNNLQLIKADDVRKEFGEIANHLLFEEIYRRMKKTLQKEDVVFDATNLISKQRKNLLSQLKGHEVHGHFILNTIETCIENDKGLDKSLGADFIVSRFLSTDIPFVEEGWSALSYMVEPLAYPALVTYKQRKNASTFEDETLQWVDVFLEEGKPYLDLLSKSPYKLIGYNNISAYIAFQSLYTLDVPLEQTKEVVKLILYKKRWVSANEKGRAKLRNELGDTLFEKLLHILPQKTI